MRLGFATAATVGYVVGTFPTADLVAHRASGGAIDLRSSGSGNPGAANALSVLGARAGLTVMAGDVAKGAVAAAAGRMLAGPAGAHIAGTAAVVGHCLPIWNGFRGGKGVATAVGQCLATFPAYFPVDVAVAAATAAVPGLRRRASTAAAVSCACWVVGSIIWWRRRLPNLWGPRADAGLPLAAVLSSTMILVRFRAAAPALADARVAA